MGENVHTEAATDFDEDLADLARPDDAHRLPVQIEAREPAQGEIEILGAVIGLVDAADGREEQRHRVFGDGIRGIRRHAHDVYPPVAGGKVDVVVPRTAESEDAHPVARKFFDDGAVHDVVDEHAHAIVPLCKLYGIRGELGLEEFERDPRPLRRGRKVYDIIFFCIKKRDLHGLPLYLCPFLVCKYKKERAKQSSAFLFLSFFCLSTA